METILVEFGQSYKEVEEKILRQLQHLFEIDAATLELKIRSHHAVKAINSIRRFKGKRNSAALQVSFNSKYFM